jgi:hypothetical protein
MRSIVEPQEGKLVPTKKELQANVELIEPTKADKCYVRRYGDGTFWGNRRYRQVASR